jgi:hypothetical protein
MTRQIGAIAIAAAFVVAACTSHEEILAVPTTGADLLPNETAIHVLSGERCRHEAACERVGPGRAWAKESDCRVAAELDERTSIGLDECPFGVEPGGLNRCIAAVRGQSCGVPMLTLASVVGCRRTELCR